MIGIYLAFSQLVMGGHSCLSTTYQPLVHPVKTEIWIVPVTCHHWYCNSAGSAIDLIGVKNVPPSDKPDQAKQDLNLASLCGVKFSTSDLGLKDVPLKVTMDVTKFQIPKLYSELPRAEAVRACLECLRRLMEGRFLHTPVTLKASDENRKWAGEIVKKFNVHDRTKVFYTPAR